MSEDRTYKPTGEPANHGDTFDIKCWKCNEWYAASCHWFTMWDKETFVKRDKRGNRMFKEAVGDAEPEPILETTQFPRVKIESIQAHSCQSKGDKYGV